MNAKTLKIIAACSMTIDHIGLYLVPAHSWIYLVLRIIGRLAYPLFAFFIVQGFRHTHNRKRYLVRLLVYAIIIEGLIAIYGIIDGELHFLEMNVIWPLVLGLWALWILDHKQWFIQLWVIPIVFLAEYARIPYGAYGVLLIVMFCVFSRFGLQTLMFIFLNILFIDFPFYSLTGLEYFAKYPWMQWGSMIAMVPIFFYNHLRGKGSRWGFYVYYPLHLAVIFIVSHIIY